MFRCHALKLTFFAVKCAVVKRAITETKYKARGMYFLQNILVFEPKSVLMKGSCAHLPPMGTFSVTIVVLLKLVDVINLLSAILCCTVCNFQIIQINEIITALHSSPLLLPFEKLTFSANGPFSS